MPEQQWAENETNHHNVAIIVSVCHPLELTTMLHVYTCTQRHSLS